MADVSKVNPHRPDYVGFVFAEGSSRRVTTGEAAAMKRALTPGILAVGVFVNQPMDLIEGLVREGVIDCVQLHGDENDAFIRNVHEMLRCPVIRAVPVGKKPPARLPAADYLLFDTDSRARGGSGTAFCWPLIAQVRTPYFLAGGLCAENVTEALRILQPYAVDISSGVETDGIKDETKIGRFIRLVREYH